MTPRDTAARILAERVLADHERVLGGMHNLPGCSCGLVVPQRTGLLPWHRAHVAERLDAAGVLGGSVLDAMEGLAAEWEQTSPAWIDPVDGPVTELRALVAQHRGGDGGGVA